MKLRATEEVRRDFDAVARLRNRNPAVIQDIEPALKACRVRLAVFARPHRWQPLLFAQRANLKKNSRRYLEWGQTNVI